MTIYSAAILISLAFLLFCFYAFAKRRLDFRYVLFWTVLSLLLIIISANVNVLERVADSLNVFYTPALVFAAALVFILAFVFYITIFITDITKRVVRLTQEVGLLKRRIEQLEKREEEL